MSFPKQLRSFREGDVSVEELEAAADLYTRAYPAKQVRELAGQIDSLYGDIYICDGDLVIDGDLDLMKPRVLFLLVKGELTVRGGFFDYDDPETLTLVCGDMHADRIHTSGWLDIMGDLVVSGPLVGNYNDCSAYIGGDLRCGLFYPESHFFEVVGRAEIDHALYVGGGIKASNTVTSISEREVLGLLPRELICLEYGSFDEEDEELEFYLDDRAITQWIRQGRPLYRSPSGDDE